MDKKISSQIQTLHDNGFNKKEIARRLNIPLSIVRQTLSKTHIKPMSKGVKKIKTLLREIWPTIRVQYEYPIGRQFLDIYLPDFGIAIEYDGEFHYEDSPFSSGGFMRQAEKDSFKDILCAEAGIRLLRISYKEIKKMTPEILLKKINELTNNKRG